MTRQPAMLERFPQPTHAWLLSALVLAGLCGLMSPAAASTDVVAGTWSASFLIRDSMLRSVIPQYEAAGHSQSWTTTPPSSTHPNNGVLTVTSELSPLVDRTPFRVSDIPNPGEADKALVSLARRLVTGTRDYPTTPRYRHEVVGRVMSWIRDNIRYDPDASLWDPDLVVQQRRANCVGIANVATALMRSYAIPTRRVRGLLFESDAQQGQSENRVTLHRWVEVYYDDIGWLMSDPIATRDFVSPLHIRLFAESSTLEAAQQPTVTEHSMPAWPMDAWQLHERANQAIEMKSSRDHTYLVDMHARPGRGMLARRMTRLQFTPLLRVNVADNPKTTSPEAELLVITRNNAGTSRPLHSKLTHTVAVPGGGPVRVAVRMADRITHARQLTLQPGEVRTIELQP